MLLNEMTCRHHKFENNTLIVFIDSEMSMSDGHL